MLVSYDGVVKIVDFGIAKATRGDQGKTAAGVMKGKAQYMSPEQALGQEVDRRTDIFALGIVLYQLVSGKHPFRQQTDVATLSKICSADPRRAAVEARRDVPARARPGRPPSAREAAGEAVAGRCRSSPQALEAALAALPGATPELREWVRATAGDRAEKKRAMIREAQKLADERQGRAPSIALPNALLALSAGAGSSPDLAGPSSVPSLAMLSVTSASQPTQPAPSSQPSLSPMSERSAPALTKTGDVRIVEMEDGALGRLADRAADGSSWRPRVRGHVRASRSLGDAAVVARRPFAHGGWCRAPPSGPAARGVDDADRDGRRAHRFGRPRRPPPRRRPTPPCRPRRHRRPTRARVTRRRARAIRGRPASRRPRTRLASSALPFPSVTASSPRIRPHSSSIALECYDRPGRAL